jgi:hypothetical protein
MSGIGVGALIDGRDPRSKTELRDALRDRPDAVEFYSTALVGEHVDKKFSGNELPADVRLDVTGPNPYNARHWWANVELSTGKGLRFDGKKPPAAKPATAAGDGTPGVVKLTGLTSSQSRALRETLTQADLENVTITSTTATFTTDARTALHMVEEAKSSAAAEFGGTGHPVQSLHAPIRKLQALAGVS